MNIFVPADILIPKTGLEKWAAVACDQYTSEPEYWAEADRFVGSSPSALRMILPETYLEDDFEARITAINKTMEEYLAGDIFNEYKNRFIYLERRLKNGKVRKGVLGAVDLEYYGFDPSEKTPVRASEGTILDRIPPRVKIRRNAPLESSHIMILADDREEPLTGSLDKGTFQKIYGFDLMADSGRADGWLVDEKTAAGIQKKLVAYGDIGFFNKKYGVNETAPLVLAVGDGNHSLATAKTIYEQNKSAMGAAALEHPSRFALAELVSIYDESLEFEPIYRVIFDIDKEELFSALEKEFSGIKTVTDQSFITISDGEERRFFVKNPTSNLTVGTLDRCLENFGGRVDYIHGEETLKKLSVGRNVGFLFGAIDKSEFFPTIIKDGSLPKKSFSMGHAADKRFYIELRKIK